MCQVQDFTNLPLNQDLSVIINVGFFSAMAGQVRIILNPPASSSSILVTVITLTGVTIVTLGIFIVVVFIALYCKARIRNDSMYDVVVQLQKLKTSSVRESKQGGCGFNTLFCSHDNSKFIVTSSIEERDE